MIKIEKDIYYLKSNPSIWSAEIIIIIDNDTTYIYDCGCDEAMIDKINSFNNINLIISHFHHDHIKNIDFINYDNLYVSAYTYRKYNKGLKISYKEFNNNHNIKVLQIPSSHCKGSLVICVDNTYLFTSDSLYPHYVLNNVPYYNRSLLKQTIIFLEELEFKYLYLSHGMKRKSKEAIIKYLYKIYESEKNQNNIINIKKGD